MSLILRMFDGEGIEIGWMRAIHDEGAVPNVDWQEPYVYDWELTHPESDKLGSVETTLRSYANPVKAVGPGETIETDEFTLHFEGAFRLDRDGPEAYLRDVATAVEREGVVRTETTKRN